jgi:FKBP-type peptidyl-prolyl cis-trans isomerase
MPAFYFILLCCLFACNTPSGKNEENANWSTNHSVSYQKEVNEREQLKIAFYLEHHEELSMGMTSTGLRYQIIKAIPKSELAQPGKTALATVKIRLLDGRICYETDDEFYEEIPIDRNDRESGLNEGLKLMRKGEKAMFILPSHLAHGLVGDLQKIPPLSILVLDVELIDLQ